MNFSEEEIDLVFGLSVSKMRTAQRHSIIRSSLEASDGRVSRHWHPADVLKVFAGSTVAAMMAVPFDAAIQIVGMMDQRAHDAITGPEVSASAMRCHIPLVCLYDRHTFALSLDDSITKVGLLVRNEKSKNAFSPEARETIDEPQCSGYAEVCTSELLSAFKRAHLQKLFAGSP